MKKLTYRVTVEVPVACGDMAIYQDVRDTLFELQRQQEYRSMKVVPGSAFREIYSDDVCDYCTHDHSQGNCGKQCEGFNGYCAFHGRRVVDA